MSDDYWTGHADGESSAYNDWALALAGTGLRPPAGSGVTSDVTARLVDLLRGALKLVPDEWESLAEEDLLDLIDQGEMLAFIAAAREALGEAA